MWTAEYSIDINASPEAIFGLFADVGRWPEWNAGTDWVELDGPFDVGTTGRMKVPDQDPLAFRLIAVGPRGFEDETAVPDAGIVVRVRHAIEPRVDGATRVVYRATIDGPRADELGPEIGPQISADFPDVLAALKERAETAFVRG
jgi:uncharacterized protein YndB with AHSA1/START domain